MPIVEILGRNYVDINGAAAALRISRYTVARRVRDGSIPAVMLGGKHRIAVDDLSKMLVPVSVRRD